MSTCVYVNMGECACMYECLYLYYNFQEKDIMIYVDMSTNRIPSYYKDNFRRQPVLFIKAVQKCLSLKCLIIFRGGQYIYRHDPIIIVSENHLQRHDS